MAKHSPRKQAKRGSSAPQTASDESLFGAARGLTLGELAALLVATPLIPSEGAAELGTGAMMAMLWFVVLAGWLGVAVLQKPPAFQFGWPDVAVATFFGLVGLNALVMASEGYARATINMTWQWLSFGVCYFLARQLIRCQTELRAICAVMIGLAVCLSALSFYQVSYSHPKMRAEYERNPEAMLRDAGIDSAEGSPERKLFKDRLDSTEPSATFALANSLAGLLVPWLVLCLGIGLTVRRWQGLDVYTLASVVLIALCLGLCLLLTKSRTAVLAVTVGTALLAMWRWRRGRTLDWRVFAAGTAAVAVLTTAILVAGAFDRLVLTEAPKSVLYRFQYWQSTTEMIADHPWFGCGPGNFQQVYTQYKLPEASESISDPHNFLLEVWSTTGTPAMLMLLAIVALLGYGVWRRRESLDESGADDATASTDPRSGQRPIYAGAGVGVLLGYLAASAVGFSPGLALLCLGVPAAAMAIYGLHRWTANGAMPIWLIVIAWLSLTINLSAAGGMSFAGIALSWWLLVAIVVNRTGSHRFQTIPQWAGAIVLAAGLLLTAGCYWTMYRPVLGCQAALLEGAAAQSERQFEQAEAAYLRAAHSDPYSVEPWMHLAAMYADAVQATGAADRLADFEQAVQEATLRRSGSHNTFRQLGNWRMNLYARLDDPSQLQQATDAYQRWVDLYPNNSLAHAQLAWVLDLVDDSQGAARAAERALQLDQRNPHRERKLAEQRIYDPTRSVGAGENAEQLMHRLRR